VKSVANFYLTETGRPRRQRHERQDGEVGTFDRWNAPLLCDLREGIRGFVGQPLLWRDELVGVLGVFLRVPAVDQALLWMRMVADHAASSIANARSFEEIERLRTQLELENEYLRDEVKVATGCCGGIIGESPALQKVLQQVKLVGPTDSTVLILGESGVGKELMARALHEQSPRKDGPLIKVNCASVPRDLFESEFFGHVQGAFTGAIRDRAGRFELADGGTLFLDEVGEIPFDMQSKLLRMLQESTFERIGEERTRTSNVRIVTATNRNLEDEVAAKRFRQDLYYRLRVFPIEVIPLCDRKEDIPLLVESFLDTQSRSLGMSVPKLKRRHISELQRYDWPGNIRELQNVIERAIIRSRTGPIRFEVPQTGQPDRPSEGAQPATTETGEREILTFDEVKRFERDNLIAALQHHNWKISGDGGAAEFLGVHPATLTSRMKAMSIRKPPTS
jgi:formate hydrogenlyase transcriptional activator